MFLTLLSTGNRQVTTSAEA